MHSFFLYRQEPGNATQTDTTATVSSTLHNNQQRYLDMYTKQTSEQDRQRTRKSSHISIPKLRKLQPTSNKQEKETPPIYTIQPTPERRLFIGLRLTPTLMLYPSGIIFYSSSDKAPFSPVA